MIIKDYQEKKPVLHKAYLAEDVSIIGDVTVEENASIWYGAVLRGDVDKIVIGEATSIQDNAVVHCATGMPTLVGKNCVVGHNAILHSCVVEENCLIGMGAVLLDGCHIGTGSIVAAGCVVSPGKVIPPNSMVMGVPGRVVRSLEPQEVEATVESVGHYITYAGAQLEQRSC
jgi:carbonic anhydrase/acetyltransferase-like protein (isoleucine patch superfamily)